MKGLLVGVIGGAVLLSLALPAAASPKPLDELFGGGGGGRGDGLVWDQQPLPTGGPGADTDFYSDSGQRVWQQVADDILLAEAATIRRIVWWGFYGGNFTGYPYPPDGPETIRVRFYDARPGDGLPGATLYEESLLNPSRTATGRIMATPLDSPEYMFQADLPTPFELDAGEAYWLEIVQVGDVDSHYRWEYSPGTETPFVVRNTYYPGWIPSGLTSNLAFQLSTVPEPAAVVPLLVGLAFVSRRKTKRKGGAMRMNA